MNSHPPLSPSALSGVVAALPSSVITLLQTGKVWLAGGFIRAIVAGEKPSDIDLWVPSKVTAMAAVVELQLFQPGAEVHESANSFTVRIAGQPVVQIIHRWCFDNPEACLESFDFTHARAVVWYSITQGWCSATDPRFTIDVLEKRQTYCAPVRDEAVAGSLFRVFKFYKRGYSIDLENLAKVIDRATGNDTPTSVSETLVTLRAAGRRLPAPPKPGDFATSDDMGEGAGGAMGCSSN